MSTWWLRMARYARAQGRALSAVLLLLLVAAALDVLKPWPLKLIVDQVLGAQPWPAVLAGVLPADRSSPYGSLAILVGATVVLFLATQGVTLLQGYLQAGAGSRMAYALGADLFRQLQRLTIRFHGRRKVGDLVRRVTQDSGCINDLVSGVVLPGIMSIVRLAVMFGIMWKLDPVLALVAISVAPILGVVIALFARPMADRSYRQQQLEGEMMAIAEQTLTALPVIQAFTREKVESARFRDLSRETVHAYLRAIASQLQFKIGANTVTALGTAAIMTLGGLHALHGELTVGGLLVLLAYLTALYSPLETLAYLSSGYAAASASARRAIEILDADDIPMESADARPLPPAPPGHRAHVVFDNVTFGYDADRPVLHGISLEARSGEMIAIVGATGAGKTTLVSLVPRFLDPTRGRVTWNGVDVRDVALADLRARIALVLQDPLLLPVSIRENIACDRPDATEAELVAAATAANADAFIRKLPRGYDTVLGERGATLSGGERQRLSIARALLKDADLLILDEPTSALDASTEADVMEAMERLRAGRTVIVIAHRLSTVRRARRIFVIESGRVVESGSHDELLAANGAYRRYHDIFLNRAKCAAP